MMAEAAPAQNEIFVYTGGDQEVPNGVLRVRIHKSVKNIPARASYNRSFLMDVEFHDEIESIEAEAFAGCISLRGIKLLGVKIIKKSAFCECMNLADVEFGDKLETIEYRAFYDCFSLESISMSSVRSIGTSAFCHCNGLSDVVCGERLQLVKASAFYSCLKLKRVILPLKDNLIEDYVFLNCLEFTKVDLVGGIHNTVASLHLERWRNAVMDEINRINQALPDIYYGQMNTEIQQWMSSVIRRLNHYKTEHHKILKEATTLLELALWKANLDDKEGNEREGVRITRRSRKRARKEICVTSGASIVIKNVLPFLVLKS